MDMEVNFNFDFSRPNVLFTVEIRPCTSEPVNLLATLLLHVTCPFHEAMSGGTVSTFDKSLKLICYEEEGGRLSLMTGKVG